MKDKSPVTDPDVAIAASPAVSSDREVRGVWRDISHVGWLIGLYVRKEPVTGPFLLAVQIGSGLAVTFLGLQVALNLAAIMNALAAGQGALIPVHATRLIGIGIGMAVVGAISVLAQYAFRIRFRRAVTNNLLGRWLTDNRFFHLEQRGTIDHPEQRIQEDTYQFIELTMVLTPTLLGAFFGIFLYTAQLWTLSPPVAVPGLAVTIPGFLVFVAYGMAIVFTVLTHWIGVSLTRAEVRRQGLEAQFRQQMGAVRQNAEPIAFSRAADVEQKRLTGTFNDIRRNWRVFTGASLKVEFVKSLPANILVIAPTFMAAPFVLDGRMQIGDLTLIAASLGAVYGGVGFLIQYYDQLAIIRSTVARLRLLDELLSVTIASDIKVSDTEGRDIQVRRLTIAYPDGSAMTEVGDLRIAPGDRLLVQGRSGAGKSTLLRSIAGLWPFGGGEVVLPRDAKIAFLPQRGYMPDGTLGSLMAYPRTADAFSDETYAELLTHFGLARLIPRLHDFEPWSRILSPGEQQRISAARAILTAPDFLFVDEATSALDETSEANLYALVAQRLPHAALISVAHRPAVERYHDTVLKLEDGKTQLTQIAHAT